MWRKDVYLVQRDMSDPFRDPACANAEYYFARDMLERLGGNTAIDVDTVQVIGMGLLGVASGNAYKKVTGLHTRLITTGEAAGRIGYKNMVRRPLHPDPAFNKIHTSDLKDLARWAGVSTGFDGNYLNWLTGVLQLLGVPVDEKRMSRTAYKFAAESRHPGTWLDYG